MLDQKVNIKKKNIVLFVYVIILSLIGPLIFWVSNRDNSVVVKPQSETKKARPSLPIPNLLPAKENLELTARLSIGDKILIRADSNSEKKAGVMAFADGDYSTAYTKFAASLHKTPNDPEALIYLNNTIAVSQGNELKIGVSVPIGGNLDVAKEILRGVAQAQHEINSSRGVDRRLVKVVIANDDNNSDLARQIANEFVKDEEILAVIGHNASNSSIAAAPVYQQGGLVMISPTSAAEELTQLGNYIFRTTPSTRALADRLAEYVVKSARKTNIAICADSKSKASTSFEEEFTWSVYERGGRISATKCDFSAPDFNAYDIPSQVVSDGADALLLAPSVVRLNHAIEVAKANQGRLTLFGNQSTNTYSILQQGQVDVNGMVSVVAWYPDANSQDSFSKNAIKLWGGSGNWRTAMAYDAAKTLIASFESGHSRQTIQQTLTNPSFLTEGAVHDVKFIPSGDRNMKGTLVRVQPGDKSGTGYDFEIFQPQRRQ